jgi:hypothetical protein
MTRLTDSLEYYLLKIELRELTPFEVAKIRNEYNHAFDYIARGLHTMADGYITRAEALMH